MALISFHPDAARDVARSLVLAVVASTPGRMGLGEPRFQFAGPRRFAGTATHSYLYPGLLPEFSQSRSGTITLPTGGDGAQYGWCFNPMVSQVWGDNLPAAVLVAPWVSHSMNANMLRPFKLDPLGATLMFLNGTATPFMRTPERAAKALLSPRAVYTPHQLHAQLGPESVIVLAQHNPPFWSPPKGVKTPLLWLAGEADAVIGERLERRSAAYYQAEYVLIKQAGHNLMMEHNYRQTAKTIHRWLVKQRIN